jgi:tRNA (cmo5U34)-methyltransferase
MEHPPSDDNTWQESASELFIDMGRVFTPARHEIARAMLDLMPARLDEPFLAVDIGTGQGWLSAAVLEHFAAARVIALDGSPTMLRHAGELLAPFSGRFSLRQFRLEDPRWLAELESGVRCFMSSLVIHHLDGDEKLALFGDIYRHLEPGGALLIADVVAPTSEPGRRHMARAWDDDVQRQSLEYTGDLRAYDSFLEQHWNMYAYPDDPPDLIDKPSTLPDQIRWLEEAGFAGVDVFWARAGHALFGGYKQIHE